MFIATLIAANPHEDGAENAACDLLAAAGCTPQDTRIFGNGRAIDIHFENELDAAKTALAPCLDSCDLFVQPAAHRVKKLLCSDMDSTMIAAECIDELADYADLRSEVTAITESAMRGEFDFAESLTKRVALLEGLPENTIEECLHERIRAMPGAGTLIATMHGLGCFNVLVSGGFHAFADPVAAGLGFNQVFANRLEMHDGKLTGRLLGDIVDAKAKADFLEQALKARNIDAADSLAIGDGANDIAMLQAAGYGIAHHAKPAARDAADAYVTHGDLTTILLAQGIDEDQWLIIPER
ncbi:phosphoserine phosphatase SerB [Sphingorhabdus sp. Alg239-R122]|uniref:phosphoserine phosphatase SerB n=1 Tax=Sphingorhabdus sp. Alg239-R122 TaxID=2305989 RepID=UPI0013DC1E3D|nr:phosphoserine phosphatase SerB [Sphingorhabdus sp. Alg239-R122]